MRMDSGWWSRNGHLPEREVTSGVGPIPIRQHRDQGRFSSAILPKYMRRAPSIDALLPALYLKGISTGDFSEALTAIFGRRSQWALSHQHRQTARGDRCRGLVPERVGLALGSLSSSGRKCSPESRDLYLESCRYRCIPKIGNEGRTSY
jgi:hypothetical protein